MCPSSKLWLEVEREQHSRVSLKKKKKKPASQWPSITSPDMLFYFSIEYWHNNAKNEKKQRIIQIQRFKLPLRHFLFAPLTKAKLNGSLVFTEREERQDSRARRGLRVSAIKRLSRWIIVKVALAKINSSQPFCALRSLLSLPTHGVMGAWVSRGAIWRAGHRKRERQWINEPEEG